MNNNIEIAVSSELVSASKADVWKKIGFYEHVKLQPPLFLRTILPVPRSVEGSHSAIGDTCRCLYSDGGFLTKRITGIVDEQIIEFEIIEQSIRFKDHIKLLGGFIEIKEAGDNTVLVTMLTYFQHSLSPQKLMNCAVRKVIKQMHRFVLEDLRRQMHQRESGVFAQAL